jgi:transposase InsO family protein
VTERLKAIDKSHPLPVTRQCCLLDVARSSAYYRPAPISEEELRPMLSIDKLHTKWPFMGSRQIRDQLRRQGEGVDRKRVQRLMRQMGIVALDPKKRTSTPDKEHVIHPYLLRNLEVNRPGRPVLLKGVHRRPQQHDVRISMDGKGRWIDNVFIEKLWRSLKYEEVYLRAYETVAEAKQSIGTYLRFFNRERTHQSLDNRTPDEVFYQQKLCPKRHDYRAGFSLRRCPNFRVHFLASFAFGPRKQGGEFAI